MQFGTQACEGLQSEPHLEDDGADQAGREQQQRHDQGGQDLVQRPGERPQRCAGRDGDPQLPHKTTLDPDPEGFFAWSRTVDRDGSWSRVPSRIPCIEPEGTLGEGSGAQHRVGWRRRRVLRRDRSFGPQDLPYPTRGRTVERRTIHGPLQPQGPVGRHSQGIGHGQDLGVETAVHLALDETAEREVHGDARGQKGQEDRGRGEENEPRRE